MSSSIRRSDCGAVRASAAVGSSAPRPDWFREPSSFGEALPRVVLGRWVAAGGLLALALFPSSPEAQRPRERRATVGARVVSSADGARRYPNGLRLCAGGDVT